jgi:hypothetical protein
MVEVTERAMVNLFHQGGTTSLAPASSLDRLGPKGAMIFQYLLFKTKLQVLCVCVGCACESAMLSRYFLFEDKAAGIVCVCVCFGCAYTCA